MDLEKGDDWTKQYSRWVEGAAAELTTVLVPGFVFPKKEKPRQLPLKYLLVLSSFLILMQLILFDFPLSQILAVFAAVVSSLILCSGWKRILQFFILSCGCPVSCYFGGI